MQAGAEGPPCPTLLFKKSPLAIKRRLHLWWYVLDFVIIVTIVCYDLQTCFHKKGKMDFLKLHSSSGSISICYVMTILCLLSG